MRTGQATQTAAITNNADQIDLKDTNLSETGCGFLLE